MSTKPLYLTEWNRIFSMIHHTGDGLNSHKDRFDKATIIERAIEQKSLGTLRWVDKKGHDLICTTTGAKIEVKTQKNCLYTEKGRLKAKTNQIKISNTLTQDLEAPLTSDFEYLVIIDTGAPNSYAVAFIDRYKLEPYLVRVSDGWTAQIPIVDLEFVFAPNDLRPLPLPPGIISYATQKSNMQKQYVSSF